MDCWRRRWQKLDLGCSLRCTAEIFTDYFLCHRCSLESRWISIGSQWLTEIGNMGLEPCPDRYTTRLYSSNQIISYAVFSLTQQNPLEKLSGHGSSPYRKSTRLNSSHQII